jgi:L-threonylcarbamoyladenylate synthase
LSNPRTPVISRRDSPLDPAVRAFEKGGIIAYPTETFYGLGVDPFNRHALERLFELKGRSFKSPVAVIIARTEMLNRLTGDITPVAERLIKRFWPGPLTMIFRAKDNVPCELTAGTGKIGARVSSNETATRLSSLLDSPLTSTSANPSGRPPARTAKEVLGYFNGGIDVLIDGGRLYGKKGSTIVDATEDHIKIIRHGDIPSRDIRECLKDI